MFTGIVEARGRVVAVQDLKSVRVFQVQAPTGFARGVTKGASVAVDGVCLTVVKKNKSTLTFELMHPTIARTTFRKKKVGAMVNLERALRIGQELGGHFVFGHVDGVGVIKNVKCLPPARRPAQAGKIKNDTLLTVSVPGELFRYFVPRGSVAINGVSLTVVGLKNNAFTVGLVPYTLAHTNLGEIKVSDEVNIEIDMLAKYVEKLLTTNR